MRHPIQEHKDLHVLLLKKIFITLMFEAVEVSSGDGNVKEGFGGFFHRRPLWEGQGAENEKH